tara:strand:- start:1296 stop:2783 length:1488 start_codon:yes stop_codon:yes gene_type:complete
VRRQFSVVLSAVPRIQLADGSNRSYLKSETLKSADDKTEAVPARAWRALFVASLGTILVGFNTTATNIALDDIQRGFPGVSAADVGWGVAIFFIGTAAFLPLCGRLADKIGRKKIFQMGLLLFALSAVFSAASPSVWLLNLSRLLQAFAGAAILPSSLALVLPLFPESRRTAAVGLWSAAGPLAAAIAPSAAAFILSIGGWRMVYLVSAPVALLLFISALFFLDEVLVNKNRQRLDVLGAAAGTIAIAAVVTAIMQGRLWGYSSVATVGVAALGAFSLVLFVVNSLRHPEPLLNLKLLRRRGVWVTNLANFLIGISSQSIWLVWPFFMKNVWDYSTVGIGVGLTVGPVAAFTSIIIFSRVADRVGPIRLCRLGACLQILAIGWQLVRLGSDVNYWADLAPGIMLFGFGWGMSVPLLNGIALAWVEESFFGETNGLFSTVRYASAAIGTAAVFAILTTTVGELALPYYDRILGFFLVTTVLAALSLWIPIGKLSKK